MLRKLGTYALIAITAMWLINNPHSAANLAHQATHELGRAATSLSTIASGL